MPLSGLTGGRVAEVGRATLGRAATGGLVVGEVVRVLVLLLLLFVVLMTRSLAARRCAGTSKNTSSSGEMGRWVEVELGRVCE